MKELNSVTGKQNNFDSITMSKNTDKFLKHLDNSIETMWTCARFLYSQGYSVKINSMKKTKNYKDWRKYADNGDLEIWVEGVSKRIEVKGLSYDFTNKEDFPFPVLIVCASHSWDMAEPKPFAYIIFNKKRTHVAIVYGKDKSNWAIERKFDKRYDDYAQEFYVTSLDKVVWKAIG